MYLSFEEIKDAALRFKTKFLRKLLHLLVKLIDRQMKAVKNFSAVYIVLVYKIYRLI